MRQDPNYFFPDFSVGKSNPLWREYNTALSKIKVIGMAVGPFSAIYRKNSYSNSKEKMFFVLSAFFARDYNKGWKIDRTPGARHHEGEPQQSCFVSPDKYSEYNFELLENPYKAAFSDPLKLTKEDFEKLRYYRPIYDPRAGIIARNHTGPLAEIAREQIMNAGRDFVEKYCFSLNGNILEINNKEVEFFILDNVVKEILPENYRRWELEKKNREDEIDFSPIPRFDDIRFDML